MEAAEQGVAGLALSRVDMPGSDGGGMPDMPSLAELAGRTAEVRYQPMAPTWAGLQLADVGSVGWLLSSPNVLRLSPRLARPLQGWGHLPAPLLGDIFQRVLEQHLSVQDIVGAWQVRAERERLFACWHPFPGGVSPAWLHPPYCTPACPGAQTHTRRAWRWCAAVGWTPCAGTRRCA